MRRYLYLYRLFFLQHMKEYMQCKVDFLIGVSSFFLTQIFGIVFLKVIFNNIPTLNGWNFYQMVFIYGYAQIPRGIDHYFTDFLWPFAADAVVEGTVDRYLLRPINILFQIVVERCQADGLGEVIVGLIFVFYAGAKLHLTVTVGMIIGFIVASIAGALIYTAVKIFFASLAFYMKRSWGMLALGYNFSDFVKYPTEIYSKPIRIIITYIIPFAFTGFIPAQWFLTGKNAVYSLGVTVAVAAVSMFLTCGFFYLSLNRYESAGN